MEYPGVGTGVAIQNEQGQFLMGFHKKRQQWHFPGGKLDMYESIQKCAIRETKEECNLEIKKLDFIGVVSNPTPPEHFVTIGFKADDWEGELQNNEPHKFETWEWFDLENLPEHMFEPTRFLLENLAQNRIFRDSN
jgi:8-oxo-dGTP diphosphatase